MNFVHTLVIFVQFILKLFVHVIFIKIALTLLARYLRPFTENVFLFLTFIRNYFSNVFFSFGHIFETTNTYKITQVCV